MAKALNHPTRAKAFTILRAETASPGEIAKKLEEKLSNVAYHVRVLEKLGLVEVVEEEKIRGAVAHFFKAVERPSLDNSAWRSLDPTVRNTLSAQTLEALFRDTAESLQAGVFDGRDDRHLSRILAELDERGWRKVVDILEDAATSIAVEQAAAAQRLNGSDQDAIHTVVALYCFESCQEKSD